MVDEQHIQTNYIQYNPIHSPPKFNVNVKWELRCASSNGQNKQPPNVNVTFAKAHTETLAFGGWGGSTQSLAGFEYVVHLQYSICILNYNTKFVAQRKTR